MVAAGERDAGSSDSPIEHVIHRSSDARAVSVDAGAASGIDAGPVADTRVGRDASVAHGTRRDAAAPHDASVQADAAQPPDAAAPACDQGLIAEPIDFADDTDARGGGLCKAPTRATHAGNACPTADPEPLKLVLLASGYEEADFVTHAPGDDSRLFVVERGGRIRLVDPYSGVDLGVFMTVPEVAASTLSYETGLLGLAFHPDYPNDPRFFVNYAAPGPGGALRTVIASFEVTPDDPDKGDPSSMQLLLEYAQPQDNHNGGMLAFGPDGCLFSASGDGGGSGDMDVGHAPGGNGQNLDTHLGKLLRLDVDDPTARPPGNLKAAGNPHIWDYGLRNPWRFSFDRQTGDLYIGDVGQYSFEEIDVEAKGDGHHNYGWNIAEGAHCYRSDCSECGLTPPVDEYENVESAAVIGGYVYRGDAIPSLRGYYLYADWSGRSIQAFTWDGRRRCGNSTLNLGTRDAIDPLESVNSFGDDARGELYVVTNGAVYRIEAQSHVTYDPCDSPNRCTPGDAQERACGSEVGECRLGTQQRTCTASCAWHSWSDCAGSLVSPEPEICANGLDEDCTGYPDDGCGCGDPVPADGAGSLVVSAPLGKLIADPARCLLYGMSNTADSGILVFDAAGRRELTHIALPEAATDLDLSPNGNWLVATQPKTRQLAVIDPRRYVVAKTVTTLDTPTRVEVADDGTAYYPRANWIPSVVSRIDLAASEPRESDATTGLYSPEVELSADGRTLYASESASSFAVYRFDVASRSISRVDYGMWPGGNDTGLSHDLLLSAGGRQLYWSGYQLPADHLSSIAGFSGRVLTDSAAGTFAVGPDRILDSVTLQTLARLQPVAEAAALTNRDRELWSYDADTGRMHYANVDDLLAGTMLGVHEHPPLPLADYAFSRVLRDPRRDRLYALDPGREVVVVVDATTLVPIVSIDAGSNPTDLAIGWSGQALFIGHLEITGLVRIDLQDLQFEAVLPTPADAPVLETLSAGRIATYDRSANRQPTIVDTTSGAVVTAGDDFGALSVALAVASDGETLFICGMDPFGIDRYDVSAGTLELVVHGSVTASSDPTTCVALPDGSGVFYGDALLDAADLGTVRYRTPANVVLVTPDGRLLTTATHVLDARDGTVLGPLPIASSVQAVSADSRTLYLATAGQITKVDLADY